MNKKGLVYESNEGKRPEMIGDEEKKEQKALLSRMEWYVRVRQIKYRGDMKE